MTQNVYGDGIDYWSPTINLQRDPRWVSPVVSNSTMPTLSPSEFPCHRSETSTDDRGAIKRCQARTPCLPAPVGLAGLEPATSQLVRNPLIAHWCAPLRTDAAAFVRGLQGKDAAKVQIVACCKHFVANSLENWMGHTRHNFNAPVSQEDLANYYLPPFRACVMEGKSLGIMCSYNAVNGVPSCANDFLLKEKLRDSWRFDGYVTSDCGAINDVCAAEPNGHGYATDCANATALSIKAAGPTSTAAVSTRRASLRR